MWRWGPLLGRRGTPRGALPSWLDEHRGGSLLRKHLVDLGTALIVGVTNDLHRDVGSGIDGIGGLLKDLVRYRIDVSTPRGEQNRIGGQLFAKSGLESAQSLSARIDFDGIVDRDTKGSCCRVGERRQAGIASIDASG